jgi:hypothetical protein
MHIIIALVLTTFTVMTSSVVLIFGLVDIMAGK